MMTYRNLNSLQSPTRASRHLPCLLYIEQVQVMIQESGIEFDKINDATLSLKHPRIPMTSTAS